MPFKDFSKYKNRVFVETGSHVGDGIQAALDSGFEQIYSIELSEFYFNYCANRFKDINNVNLILGDSSTVLRPVIENINEPITFWLDGHWSGDNTAMGDIAFPIISELSQIKHHPIKNHTILIDDVRLFSTEWGLDASVIISSIYEINNNYNIFYDDGLIKGDVLVARIPNA